MDRKTFIIPNNELAGGKENNSNLKLIVNQLHVQSVRRSDVDIEDWRLAHKTAEFLENPNPVRLQDLYEEAMLDGFLAGIVGKRFRKVRNKRLRFLDSKGEEVEAVNKLIESRIFRKIRKKIFYTSMFGRNGLEFIPGKKIKFLEIPRKHINTKLKLITKEQGGSEGYDYENTWNLWVMESDEEENNHGLLLKAVPWCIYKRGNVADYAIYIEQFGQPTKIGEYEGTDQESRRVLKEALEEAGSSLSIILPKGANVRTLDGKASNGDGMLQSRFNSMCNEELLVLILGNTETTKSSKSSGYAQSKEHGQQESEIIQDDMDTELDFLNDEKFINILKSYGYPVEGGHFEHEEEADTAWMLENLKVDEMLTKQVPLSDDYYYETYKRPKPDNYDELKAQKEERDRRAAEQEKKASKGKKKAKEEEDDEEEEDTEDLSGGKWDKLKKFFLSFFLTAPHREGLLTTELSSFYQSRCEVCGKLHLPHLADEISGNKFTAIVEDIATQLVNNELKKGQIHTDLYRQTADTLMKAVFEGLGAESFSYEDPMNELRAYLEHNVHTFSAAKSLVELEHFRSLMVDGNGKLRTFTEFRNACTDSGYLFNKTYLETEFANAIATSQAAATWHNFGEEDALQISTAGDERVRPKHAQLDGFTALKSDPIWLKLWTPFDWGCRCHIIPGVKSRVSDRDRAGIIKEAGVPKYFQRNPAVNKVVYNDEHPYYKQAGGKLKELAAETNYNLPAVKSIYAQNDFAAAIELESKDQANAFWKQKAGKLRESFDVVDNSGNTIRFNNKFRTHVLEDNKDQRFKWLANCEDIVANPDEVWSYKERGVLKKTYLKYYDGFPQAVKVNGTDAFTMYRFETAKGGLNVESLGRTRRGALLYKK